MRTAPNAEPDTLQLALRIMNHLMVQITGRCVRSPATDAAQAMTPNVMSHVEPVAAPVPAIAPVAPATAERPSGSTPTKDGHPIWLSDAIKRWRNHDGIRFSDETWNHSYKPTFRIFRELLGNERRDIVQDDGSLLPSQLDRRIDTISRSDIEQLYEQLKVYPSRQGKRIDELEAPQRIQIARAEKRRVQSPANVDKLLEQINPCLSYMADKGWVSHELCWEMKLQRQAAIQRASKAAEAKPHGAAGAVALAIGELKRTFEQPAYLQGAITNDWAYFIDPIRLYVGPRVSEVAQLYIEDIIHVDGIPCFSFAPDLTPDPDEDEAAAPKHRKSNKAYGPQTEAEYRRLKNKASRRVVPIHPALIEMGFLDFVESRRRLLGRGDTLLFSGLGWHPKSGYGRKPSEHTLKLLKQAGVWKYRCKVGHSLRSNAAQEFERVGIFDIRYEVQRRTGSPGYMQPRASGSPAASQSWSESFPKGGLVGHFDQHRPFDWRCNVWPRPGPSPRFIGLAGTIQMPGVILALGSPPLRMEQHQWH